MTMWKTAGLVLLVLVSVGLVASRNDDRFNYRSTVGRDFGPTDWNRVTCDDVQQCLGWPDDWLLGEDWGLFANTCRWCPQGSNRCGRHHQSPINLERNRAIESHPLNNTCIDSHWMKYEDSSCTWDVLKAKNAFTVERHTLKISQPVEPIAGDPTELRIACPKTGGRRFGRIDFSKGFADWWFLSHIDVKVPSEHYQEGKRYSAEVQMYHFYSINAAEAGVNNEMATVSIFLEAYEDAPPYPYLDRVICQWRLAEDRTREQCGLPSVQPYPGCWNPTRGQTPAPTPAPTTAGLNITDPTTPNGTVATMSDPNGRMLRGGTSNAFDVLTVQPGEQAGRRKLQMDEANFRGPDMTDDEWAEWIERLSSESREAEEAAKARATTHATSEDEYDRHLLEGEYLPFHNYQFLIDVKTEYYFRYSGTATVPPCYGPFTLDSRGNSTHWRMLKDPIRIHPRQLAEMERLLSERRAPPNAQFNACQVDTAATVLPDGRVSVARPIQQTNRVHYKVFCECDDWISRWPEDRAWCTSGNKLQRFYDRPYNFETEDF